MMAKTFVSTALSFCALALVFASTASAAAVNPRSFQKVDLSRYDYVDPRGVVPDKPLRQALSYFETYKDRFPNQNYIVVIDFTQHSSKKRMYVINMKSGDVTENLVAHGAGSDPDGDGYATKFSNVEGSRMSSLGFYRTAEIYYGDHGRSMRLDGLSPTNSNARDRDIVFHPADYVDEDGPHAGRSWGCPAVDPSLSNSLIDKIRGGAMIYAWYNQ